MAVNSFNAQNPPVTTKGDVFTFSTIPTRLGVGANDTVLTADSTAATGLKWATPSSGSYTQLATGTLSGTEVSLTSISGSYQELVLVISAVVASSNQLMNLRINNRTTSDYQTWYFKTGSAGSAAATTGRSALEISGDQNITGANTNALFTVRIPNYAMTGYKTIECFFSSSGQTASTGLWGFANITAAITSLQMRFDGTATFSSGTYTLYGVK